MVSNKQVFKYLKLNNFFQKFKIKLTQNFVKFRSLSLEIIDFKSKKMENNRSGEIHKKVKFYIKLFNVKLRLMRWN